MASHTNYPVCLESVEECRIREVTLTGDEIYIKPPTMSESLTELALKINFSKNEEEYDKQDSEDNKYNYMNTSDEEQVEEEEEEEEEIDPSDPFQKSKWPWDSVRNKLKHAFTEMCVLQDILKLAKRKQYLAIDSVIADEPDNKKSIHLIAKKRALTMSSTILSSGQDRLRKSLEITSKLPDFHKELQSLRQSWRLKKAGNCILGDLSYKTAGSRYNQTGTFEIKKTLDSNEENINPIDCPLIITIPSELQGLMYIQVAIKHLADDIHISKVGIRMRYRNLPKYGHWQRRLESAQNIIFCKELFIKISQEAVQYKSKMPHVVLANQIYICLFPGTQLSIALRHFTDGREEMEDEDNNKRASAEVEEMDHMLEHSLHQLLRREHHRNASHSLPHPSTGAVGLADKAHYGPAAYSQYDINSRRQNDSILAEIIQQSKHVIVRKSVLKVLDDLAKQLKDPQICVHSLCNNTSTNSRVAVNITTPGYELLYTTSFVMDISSESIRCHSKGGNHMKLSWEAQNIRDYTLDQISRHQVAVVKHLAKLVNWVTLSVNANLGIGRVQAISTAQSIKLASQHGSNTIIIHSGPVSGISVYVAMMKSKVPRQVDFTKIEGTNFINKLETLMIILSD